jgi:hypothetical protein
MEDLVVYSLPVSGGAFVVQTAFLKEIFKARQRLKQKYKPNLVFGASGGNIAAYVGLAADWTPEGIDRVCKTFTPGVLIQPWFPIGMQFIPSVSIGIFSSSMYRAGYGCGYIYDRVFSDKTIDGVEIWTGTFNIAQNKAEFICNKKEENALIRRTTFEESKDIHETLSLKYLGDDDDKIKKISDYTLASASIPILAANKVIDGDSYADGGSVFSSPTSALIDEVYRVVKGISTSSISSDEDVNVDVETGDITFDPEPPTLPQYRLCHFYFCPRDYQARDDHGFKMPAHVLRLLGSMAKLDRTSCIELLRRVAGDRSEEIIVLPLSGIKINELHIIFEMLNDQAEHYLCIMSPQGNPLINLSKFQFKDIQSVSENVQALYDMNVWYLPY